MDGVQLFRPLTPVAVLFVRAAVVIVPVVSTTASLPPSNPCKCRHSTRACFGWRRSASHQVPPPAARLLASQCARPTGWLAGCLPVCGRRPFVQSCVDALHGMGRASSSTAGRGDTAAAYLHVVKAAASAEVDYAARSCNARVGLAAGIEQRRCAAAEQRGHQLRRVCRGCRACGACVPAHHAQCSMLLAMPGWCTQGPRRVMHGHLLLPSQHALRTAVLFEAHVVCRRRRPGGRSPE